MNIWISRKLLDRALTIVIVLANSAAVFAQDTQSTESAETASDSQITVERIESSLAELDQCTDIPEDIKLQAKENYQAAIKNLQSAGDFESRRKSLISDTDSVAARSQQLRTQKSELKDKKPTIETGLDLMQLEQLLPAAELRLSGFKKTRQEAEADLQSRSTRRKEIRARLITIQEKIADASTQLKTLENAEPTSPNLALTTRLQTRKVTLEKEKPALEAELARFDAEETADLVRLRMEVAGSNAVYTEKFIALLQQKINTAREAAAAEAVRAARQEAIDADPSLKVYAEQNQTLTENAKTVAESLATTESELSAASEAYDELVRQFVATKKKVDTVGLSSSVGAMLRKQTTTLPDVSSRRAAVAERQQLITDTQYQIFEYEEQQQELADIDGLIESIVKKASKHSSKHVTLLESAVRALMNRKKEYLADLVRCNGKYFDTLIELDTVDQQIIALQAEYRNYIDERVLWIRSGPPLTSGIHVHQSDTSLVSPAKWQEAFTVLIRDAERNPALYLVALSCLGILFLRSRRIGRRITEIGELAKKSNCRSIGPTLYCLLLSSVISIGWPLLCLFVGWRLSKFTMTSEFTGSIGQGLMFVGLLWGCVELIRQLCRRNGVGESHFRWPNHATSLFRREVYACAIVALPIFFVSSTLASSDGIHERGDVQRIAFIVGMFVIGFCIFRLCRPRGVFRGYLLGKESSLPQKLRHFVPLAGAALPLSLAALAAAGYFFTAQTLYWRLLATFMFLATLFVARSVFFRMLLLRRRHLSIEQSRKRAAEARSVGEEVTDSQQAAGIVKEDTLGDISTHSLQSRNLISAGMSAVALVGLWLIWIQVLPALSMIGNHAVWGNDHSVTRANVAPPTMSPMLPTSESSNETLTYSPVLEADDSQSDSVTVSDLAFAVLILVVTVVLFRNGPGLLEISVLQQLPVETSVRYAITTLVSYVIVMIGVIAACSTIGLQWSQIQWLATALTFGLAFGLQEMFANFVAGLIILIERPVRVGDVVTVDEVTGVVSRIRIRATSITNWDRKEYVVPNKEFITGKLLNWTLSDKVNRITIEVGLAYGSDTEQARQLLLQVAQDHPSVLEDPAPIATFERFGDNSLNLVLRAFLPCLENRLGVIHELHTAIDKTLRDAEIEVAFPQRDLHIRSVSGLSELGIGARKTVDTEAGHRDAA